MLAIQNMPHLPYSLTCLLYLRVVKATASITISKADPMDEEVAPIAVAMHLDATGKSSTPLPATYFITTLLLVSTFTTDAAAENFSNCMLLIFHMPPLLVR